MSRELAKDTHSLQAILLTQDTNIVLYSHMKWREEENNVSVFGG